MRINPRYRSVASIRYDDRVEMALRELGIRYIKVGPHEDPSEDSVINSVVNSLGNDRELDVVVDLGGYALEPITYVFGMDSVDVALKIISIALKITQLSPNPIN